MYLNGRLDAAVESDIVGYATITMEAGNWYMIATPFVNLDENLQVGATINELYSDVGFTTGDMLYILFDGKFFEYYWIQGDSAETSGWSTRPTRLVEDTETILEPGEAVYIKKASKGDITLAGKVEKMPASFGLEDSSVWAMVTPIWPDNTKCLNDYIWTGLESNDMLYRAENGKFYEYYWIQGDSAETSGWSTRPTRLVEDKEPLSIGEAVYINKKSKGVASVQAR